MNDLVFECALGLREPHPAPIDPGILILNFDGVLTQVARKAACSSPGHRHDATLWQCPCGRIVCTACEGADDNLSKYCDVCWEAARALGAIA